MTFVYITKIHKYQRTFLLKKCAHNITQYGIKIKNKNLMMMSSPYITLQK